MSQTEQDDFFQAAQDSDMRMIRLTERECNEIALALKLAVNGLYQGADNAEKETLMQASFAWRRAQTDYDPMVWFVADCEWHGSD